MKTFSFILSLLIFVSNAYAANCMDNINTAMIISAAGDTLSADTCVTVVEPCLPNADIIIPDSAFSNAYGQLLSSISIYIQGRFYINNNLTLQDCYVTIAPGGQIIVMQDLLELDNTVTEGCGFMWRGIHLVSGSANILVHNNSRISDADYGIYAENETTVKVFNSEITECVTGIYTEPNTSGNYNIITAAVYGTRFGMWNSGTLKPAYIGQPPHGSIPRAGIELNNVAGMVIGNYSNNKNQFNRMHSGVVGWGSDFRVLNCEFTNLQNDAAYAAEYAGTAVISKGEFFISKARVRFQQVGGGGNTVTSCTRGAYTNYSDATITNVKMDMVNTGVVSTHTSMNKEVTVEACEITAGKYGVYFYFNAGAKNMIAQDNTIHVSTKGSMGILAEEMTSASTVPYRIERNFVQTTNGYGGIVCNNLNRPVIDYNSIKFSHVSAAAQMYGIEINGNVRPQVSCNNVMSNTVSAADTTKIGIAVKISSNSNVSCNTVDSTGYGFFFGGICTGTSFKGNYIRNHYTGLYFNKVAVISQQPAGGTPPYHGNEWLDTTAYTSGYGAVNMNDSIFLLQQSMFTVNPNSSNYNPKIPLNNGNPPFYVDNSLWFDFGSGGTLSCAASTTCNAALTGGDEDIDLRERIANDESLTIEYVSESKSIAKLLLFTELIEDSTLTSGNSTLENFVTVNENSNYGYLYVVEQSFKQAINLSDSMSAVFSSVDSLHNILGDSLQMASIFSNLVIRSSLIYELNTLNALRISLHGNSQLISKEKLDEASGYFNLITGGDDPVQNLKFVNEVFYQYQLYGINAIIPLYNDIFSVASKCIYKCGEAVIRARTMFSILNDTIQFDDAANCSQFGIFRLVEGKEIDNTTVFIKVNPNPSVNTINISVKDMKDGICDILIENILGQQVYKNYFECKNELYVADITFLPAGVYTVKVKANGILNKKKIIKLNGIPVLLLVILLSLPLAGKGQGFNKYWLLGGDTGFLMGKFEFEINSYNLIVEQR
ncbi:MAG: T9SS type A sorting domain-containing protein, partial [Bacteroidia bacterium]|nr:T9SS type A sorting domain-containing protein [Bacteroidia bacterium]